jgi:hypothetical protein
MASQLLDLLIIPNPNAPQPTALLTDDANHFEAAPANQHAPEKYSSKTI